MPLNGGFDRYKVKNLTHDELLMAVVEIKVIINSRPLLYVSTEYSAEPLTPSHLQTGSRVATLPDTLSELYDMGDEDFELSSMQLSRRMKHLSNVMNLFWSWRNDSTVYLCN